MPRGAAPTTCSVLGALATNAVNALPVHMLRLGASVHTLSEPFQIDHPLYLICSALGALE